MGIGVGIFLIAVGAVLAFAVHVTTSGVDLHTVGWILMVVGAIGLLVDLAIFAPRRRRVTALAEPTAAVTERGTYTDEVR